MKQMRGGMVAPRPFAAVFVHRQRHGLAGTNVAALDGDMMHEQERHRLGRRRNCRRQAAIRQAHRSGVADLSAGFAIARRHVNHDFHAIPGLRRIDDLLVFHDGQNRRGRFFKTLIAGEARRRNRAGKTFVNVGNCRLARAFPRFAGAAALRAHLAVKRLHIHRQMIIFRHILRQIEREAERVVQPENFAPV